MLCLRCVLQELDVSQGYPNTNLKAPAGLRIQHIQLAGAPQAGIRLADIAGAPGKMLNEKPAALYNFNLSNVLPKHSTSVTDVRVL